MPEDEYGTAAGQERLSRYWDALTQGTGQDPTGLDPMLVAALRRFHALDAQERASNPDPVFVNHLLEDLMITTSRIGPAPFTTALEPEPSANGHAPGAQGRSSSYRLAVPGRQGISARLATAALLVLTLVAGLFASGAWSPRSRDSAVGVPAIGEEQVSTGELEFLWESDGGIEPLGAPYGLGIDPLGNLWLATATTDSSGEFRIFAPDGAVLETWGESGAGEGQLDFFASEWPGSYGDVAFDADGNFYVADTGNHRIQKFGPNREFLVSWGEKGDGDGQFRVPESIAVSADGRVYVSDPARGDIQTFDSDGQFLGATGRLGFIGGVAVDEDGSVWVTFMEENQVQQLSSAGEPIVAWGRSGSEAGALQWPTDVAVDGLGRVYVADTDNFRLQVLTPDGQFLAEVGGFGTGPGLFNEPRGVAVGADGTVYVSDRNSVQAFRVLLPDGYALMS